MTLSVTPKQSDTNRYNDDVKYLKETIHKQNELLEKLDQMLMESLKQSQETKMLLLAAKEEQKKKKSIFSFFNKN